MTHALARGGNIGLTQVGLPAAVTVTLAWDSTTTMDADLSAFLVGATGKVRSDADFIFFNQPVSTDGSIRHLGKSALGSKTVDRISINTAAVPADIEKIVIGASADGGTFGSFTGLVVEVADDPSATPAVRAELPASTETAFVFAEVYKRNGEWKVRAVGQGYTTGLGGLATDHGVDIEGDTEDAGGSISTELAGGSISMEKKRLVNLEKTLTDKGDSKMVSLIKSAGVSLQKKGLSEHTARVALVLDISGSMAGRYKKGLVQRLAERVLALGLRFDDDGVVDVFLFGKQVHTPKGLTLQGYESYVADLIRGYPLEYDTKYGAAMKAVREHYFGSAGERVEVLPDATPVYVMFITDGAPSDKGVATKHMRSASYEPIFWQFMGVGSDRFEYLQRLDDLDKRFTDNADFFAVTDDELMGRNPISDEALFERLMTEYPDWLRRARAAGMLTATTTT